MDRCFVLFIGVVALFGADGVWGDLALVETTAEVKEGGTSVPFSETSLQRALSVDVKFTYSVQLLQNACLQITAGTGLRVEDKVAYAFDGDSTAGVEGALTAQTFAQLKNPTGVALTLDAAVDVDDQLRLKFTLPKVQVKCGAIIIFTIVGTKALPVTLCNCICKVQRGFVLADGDGGGKIEYILTHSFGEGLADNDVGVGAQVAYAGMKFANSASFSRHLLVDENGKFGLPPKLEDSQLKEFRIVQCEDKNGKRLLGADGDVGLISFTTQASSSGAVDFATLDLFKNFPWKKIYLLFIVGGLIHLIHGLSSSSLLAQFFFPQTHSSPSEGAAGNTKVRPSQNENTKATQKTSKPQNQADKSSKKSTQKKQTRSKKKARK